MTPPLVVIKRKEKKKEELKGASPHLTGERRPHFYLSIFLPYAPNIRLYTPDQLEPKRLGDRPRPVLLRQAVSSEQGVGDPEGSTSLRDELVGGFLRQDVGPIIPCVPEQYCYCAGQLLGEEVMLRLPVHIFHLVPRYH